MTQRTSIFAKPSTPDNFDVSDFRPKPPPDGRPSAAAIDSVSGFQSREARSSTAETSKYTKRQPLVYRTGRNVVLSVKATQTTIEQFYSLAEQNGWKVAEAFEHAVAALAEKISKNGG